MLLPGSSGALGSSDFPEMICYKVTINDAHGAAIVGTTRLLRHARQRVHACLGARMSSFFFSKSLRCPTKMLRKHVSHNTLASSYPRPLQRASCNGLVSGSFVFQRRFWNQVGRPGKTVVRLWLRVVGSSLLGGWFAVSRLSCLLRSLLRRRNPALDGARLEAVLGAFLNGFSQKLLAAVRTRLGSTQRCNSAVPPLLRLGRLRLGRPGFTGSGFLACRFGFRLSFLLCHCLGLFLEQKL